MLTADARLSVVGVRAVMDIADENDDETGDAVGSCQIEKRSSVLEFEVAARMT